MASNCCGAKQLDKVKCWTKNKHEYIEEPCS